MQTLCVISLGYASCGNWAGQRYTETPTSLALMLQTYFNHSLSSKPLRNSLFTEVVTHKQNNLL